MPDKQVLHLIVPGICGPLAELETLRDDSVLSKWVKTLSKSNISDSGKSYYEVLNNILKSGDDFDFPSASLSLMAEGAYDPEKFYLHADPVHLEADMDHAILTSVEDLKVHEQEADALLVTLNKHFEQDGLFFFITESQQWFVTSAQPIQMKTTSLKDATGRNINFLLPAGRDASRWKQLLTEAQMLMFTHEVNLNREKNRQLSINSLWFHGAGNTAGLNEDSIRNIASICSDQTMLKGLADFSEIRYREIPSTVNDYADFLLSDKSATDNILHISDLEHLINYTDVNLWLEQLSVSLENWVYPLLKIANRNNIDVMLYPCNEKQYHFSKYDNMRFWRRGKLEHHVDSY